MDFTIKKTEAGYVAYINYAEKILTPICEAEDNVPIAWPSREELIDELLEFIEANHDEEDGPVNMILEIIL